MQKSHIDYTWETLLQASRGQWSAIFASLLPSDLIDHLTRHGHRKHTWCPGHGGNDGDAFRFFDDWNETGGSICNTCKANANGLMTLCFVNNWTEKEAFKQVCAWHRGQGTAPPRRIAHTARRRNPTEDDEKLGQTLLKMWNESLSIADPGSTVARDYLRSRGLERLLGTPDNPRCDFANIRFAPELWYFHPKPDSGPRKPPIKGYGAILSLMASNSFQRITIHRTWITAEGKAPVPEAKKMMPVMASNPLSGQSPACWISDPGPVVNLCEGMETALSVWLLTGVPTAAVTSSTLMLNWEPPRGVRGVCVWADLDKAGLDAARHLNHALPKAGVEMIPTMVPPEQLGDKPDWNDAIQSYGIDAWKSHLKLRQYFRDVRRHGGTPKPGWKL